MIFVSTRRKLPKNSNEGDIILVLDESILYYFRDRKWKKLQYFKKNHKKIFHKIMDFAIKLI